MKLLANTSRKTFACYDNHTKTTVIKSGNRVIDVTVRKNMNWYKNDQLLHDNPVPDVTALAVKMEYMGL